MSERNWDKELAKIDKQLESVSDSQMFPEKRNATPAQKAEVAAERSQTSSWPAILRLTLSVALGVGILFWPYANRCGVGLAGYLFGVTAVSVSGIWSAVWTWRHRTAKAHTLSILLILWGLILGAIELLPRVGYARQSMPWSCTVQPTTTPQPNPTSPTNSKK